MANLNLLSPKSFLSYFMFLLAFAFVTTNAQASHLMGAQISYKSLGNNKYQFTLDYFRDCRGIPFNSPTIILRGISGCSSTINLSASQTSITDITPICSSVTKMCKPTNTTISSSAPAIEKHTFIFTYDFTTLKNNGCCIVQLGTGQCCRNGAITTGASGNDFWVYAQLDLCKVTNNTSPEFINDPVAILKCNLPTYLNVGARDLIDNDSLVYELIDPTQSWSTKTYWTGSLSSLLPFTTYCKGSCSPAYPNEVPPRGFYFNRLTGDYVFTPINCSEITISAVRITEYRKNSSGTYENIGSVMRDWETIVMNMSGNNVPLIQGPELIYFADSSNSSFLFATKDDPFIPSSGPPVLNDTIKFNISSALINSLKNSSFQLVDSTQKHPTGVFNWKPMGMINSRPYQLIMQVRDNACNYNAITQKAVNVWVKKRSELVWIEGTVYFDANSNCKRDSSERPLSGASVSLNGGQTINFITDNSGYFGGFLPPDSCKIFINGSKSYTCSRPFKTASGKSYSLNVGVNTTMRLTGSIYRDSIVNCKIDSLDPLLKNHLVYTIPYEFASTTDSKGNWEMKVPPGDYKIIYSPKRDYHFVKCPTSPHSVSISKDTVFKDLNYAIFDSTSFTDISVSLFSSAAYKRGTYNTASVVVRNNGTQTVSSNVWLKFNKKLKYSSGSSYAFKSDSTIQWSFNNLKPEQEITYKVIFLADTTTCKINDTITTRVWLDTAGLSNDVSKKNNSDFVKTKIVSTHLYNDKEEHNTSGFAWREGNNLRYFIKFQNTGKDTAVNVTLTDTLHYALLPRTLILNGASHPYEYVVKNNILTVNFLKINLPDTAKSKENSAGHIDFSINIDPNINLETKIVNKATIYFDTLVYKTNKINTTYTSLVKTGKISKTGYCPGDSITVSYSSPFSFSSGNTFKLVLSNPTGQFGSGTKIIDTLASTSSSGNFKTILPSTLKTGTYLLKVISNNPKGSILSDGLSNSIEVYDNSFKPILKTSDTLFCNKDTIAFTVSGSFDNILIYDRKQKLDSIGAKKSFKLKLSNGRHYLTAVSTSSKSCKFTSDTLVFMSDSLPKMKLSSTSHPNLRICGNDTVTLKVSGAVNYDLLGNSLVKISSHSSSPIKVLIPNNGDKRTVRGFRSSGCKDTSNTLVFLKFNRPTVKMTVSDADLTICQGDNVTFTGTGAVSYQLYRNDSAFLTPFSNNITTSAIYNGDKFKIEGTDANGCTSISATITMIVNPLPNTLLNCSDSDLTLCKNASVTLSFSGASTYRLFKNGVFWIAPPTNPYSTTAIINRDVLHVEGTSAKGCKSQSNSMKFRIISPFTGITLENTGSICITDTVYLKFTNGIKYNLYKNGSLHKTIYTQRYASRDFVDKDVIYVQGTDSFGCVANSKSIVLNLLSKPIITLSNLDADNAHCEGDYVDLEATGGVMYDLYLNNTFWKSSFGTFSFQSTLKNMDELYAIGHTTSGCFDKSNTLTVTVYKLPTIVISNPDADNAFCKGYQVILKLSGAKNYDLYKNNALWKSNSDSTVYAKDINDKDEIYAIGVDKNNCSNTSSPIQFKTYDLPDIKLKSSNPNNVFCTYSEVKLYHSGASIYDVYKNKILFVKDSPDSTIIYQTIDKDEYYTIGTSGEGCKDTSNKIKLKIFPIPVKPKIKITGNTLSSDYTYGNQWYGANLKIPGATNQQLVLSKTGIYYVVHTDSNGCVSSESDEYNFVAFISKIQIPGLKIYPNPATDYLIIETAEPGTYSVKLTDMAGRLIKEEAFAGKYFEWRVNPSKGIYTLKISNEKGHNQVLMVEFN
jgi:hypothetical protein